MALSKTGPICALLAGLVFTSYHIGNSQSLVNYDAALNKGYLVTNTSPVQHKLPTALAIPNVSLESISTEVNLEASYIRTQVEYHRSMAAVSFLTGAIFGLIGLYVSTDPNKKSDCKSD
ncbi:MAG: hypothetical protein WC254_07045 [Candidatus Woesearchaeota archaeon]|jgi:hypothetical protein